MSFAKKATEKTMKKFKRRAMVFEKIFLGGNQVDLAASDVTQCVKLVE